MGLSIVISIFTYYYEGNGLTCTCELCSTELTCIHTGPSRVTRLTLHPGVTRKREQLTLCVRGFSTRQEDTFCGSGTITGGCVKINNTQLLWKNNI